MRLILIACSSHKHRHKKEGPAREIYTGTLLRLALRYSEEQGLEPWILSARYNWIRPDTVIATYDERRTSPFTGPWPEEPAVYVGGKDYFGKAPEHIKPLVVGATSQSAWVTGVLALCQDKGPVAAGERKMKIGGKTDFIFNRLLAGPITKADLYLEMVEEFGENPGMKITINCQLLQSRAGAERLCTIHREGDRYWATR